MGTYRAYRLVFDQPLGREPGDAPHSGRIAWETGRTVVIDAPTNEAAIFIAQDFIGRLTVPSLGYRGEPVRARKVSLADDGGNEIWRIEDRVSPDPLQ